jgi:3-methyl-2-oxobutanoate hydroxymethyltransferase
MEADQLRADTKMLNDIGCFAVVFEKIPADLAREASTSVACPTIGIGAGSGCDGQVLVLHDMLGITQSFSPRFLRRYLDMSEQMNGAIQQYVKDVRTRDFPNESEQY